MIAVVTSGHKPDDERVYHREISSLLNAGYTVHYFTRWDGDSDLSNGNLHHQNYPRSSTSIKQYIQILNQKIASNHSVLHIHEFDMLPLAKQLKKNHGTKIIYDVHDTLRAMWDTFSSKKGFMKKVVNRSLSFFETSHLMYVDEVILANRVMDENYYADKGLSTTVVENFPSRAHISKDKELSDEPVIIYQGQISNDRGIALLIEAFDQIKEKFPRVKLQLIGTSRTEQFDNILSSMIENSQFSQDIEWISEVSYNKVWDYLKDAHIGVIPSLLTPRVIADTPTKLFEYMAAGCVTVASDVPPVRHFLEGAGMLVKANDSNALAESALSMLKNNNRFEAYSNESQKRIMEDYNWEAIEGKLLDLYKKVTE